MFLLAAVAKMPSSRIIKSDNVGHSISSFNFRSIQRGTALTLEQSSSDSGAFMPLEIFDTSELKGHHAFVAPEKPQEVQEPEIPGRFVSDEELQQQQQESYQRGLQDGKNLAERGLANAFRALRSAAEELSMLRDKVLRDSEDDLLDLVMSISRKVIAREVDQSRDIVLSVIKSALQNLSESDELTIRVNPDDHSMLTGSSEQSLKKELSSVKFLLKSDPALQQGSCQIDTSLGTVDASFEAQLEEIYRRLLEERTSSHPTQEQVTSEL